MRRWFKATATATSPAGETRAGTGFSTVDGPDAQARAAAAAQRAAERADDEGDDRAAYPYGVRPLVEPVLHEWRRDDGALSGLLTVNSRGCVVLNTANVMFVDVDLPEPPAAAGGWLGGLFGRKPAAPPADAAAPHLAKLSAYVAAFPGWGFRAYRTAAGLRYLCTSALHDPAAPHTLAVLAELGNDPRYRLLCEKQACFRARLTPKPHRVHGRQHVRDHGRRPYRAAALADPVKPPATNYERRARDFAVCQLLGHFGEERWHPEAQLFAEVHDQYTRPTAALPLA